MQQVLGASTEIRDTSLGTRKRRKPLSCEPCRRSKLRCDRRKPCNTCLRRACQTQCNYYELSDNDGTVDPHRGRGRYSGVTGLRQAVCPLATPSSPLPRGASPPSLSARTESNDTLETISQWDAVFQRPTNGQVEAIDMPGWSNFPFSPNCVSPVAGLLGVLPPLPCCEYLVAAFFTHVSPLLPILDGPTFQKQFFKFVEAPEEVDLSWLAKLFVMCSLALLSKSADYSLVQELWPRSDIDDAILLSVKLRNLAKECLSRGHFMVRHTLHTLEALLILVYGICHTEGVERSWALLGAALNIGIALKCHTEPRGQTPADKERRQLCWAGILMLHTYQAILFRDIDLSYLVRSSASISATNSSFDLNELPSSQFPRRDFYPQLMAFKLRLFRLSNHVCSQISDNSQMSETALQALDAVITEEQDEWSSTYLVNGMPSVIDNASYAHWCILQTYAHQLRLLLHRPFHHSRSAHFRENSRTACISSSTALLDLHRQLCEMPRLRCYRWLVLGMTSFNALHGAIALTSCLLDTPPVPDETSYISAIEATADRIAKLRTNSPVCANAHPILHKLQLQLNAARVPETGRDITACDFDDWIENVDWFNPEAGWISPNYILIGRPYWTTFKTMFANRAMVNIQEVEFGSTDPFSLEALKHYEETYREAQQSGKNIRAILLCNPHNPLGRCYSRQVLEKYMKFCHDKQIHLISDEIYALSVHTEEVGEPFTSVLSIETRFLIEPELIHVVWGMSKDFGATGLRIGCLVSQSNQLFLKASTSISLFNFPSSLADNAVAAMLTDRGFTDNFITIYRKRLRDSYEHMVTTLESHGIPCQKSNATLFIWANLRTVIKDDSIKDEDILRRLREEGVYITSGEGYRSEQPGWFRLVFAHPKLTLDEGLKRVILTLGTL
ncbi:hypothetical protein GQX73_g7586 [Xylaria multiplex]|uniref:Zn(2)-C6 fungal-type domain-containing protein n=1 Tax=Xylaria multiplex TaxID=323545 RepID=A0A7C8MJ52_9PEZI|nr:hypothetical protein GQX73_g7586 [Xylaria multiplex]